MYEGVISDIASLLVFVSILPYAFKVVRREIEPNLVTWSLWTLTSCTLLIIYWEVGNVENIKPFLIGFLNPLGITGLALYYGSRKTPELEEIKYIIISITLILWLLLSPKDVSNLEHILYVAIVANIFATIPTIKFVIKNPEMDKPLSWSMFGTGHCLALFAANEHTVENCIFSVYLLIMAGIITFILLNYRIRSCIPFSKWI